MLKLNKKVKWYKYMERKNIFKFYEKNNFLIFPSLRDSGGLVLLEAMSKGTVIAGLNIGGPGEIIDSSTGIKVNIKDKTHNEIVNKLTKGIISLIKNKKKYQEKSKNCLQKVNRYIMSNKISIIYRK